MQITEATIRDAIVAASIVAAVVLFVRTPFIWIVELVRLNPNNDVIWHLGGNHTYWCWAVGASMLVSLFAWKAKSAVKGILFPLGFSAVYVFLITTVAALIPFYLIGWLPFIIIFSSVGGLYYLAIRRLFGKHLNLDGTMTESVIISGPIVLMQFMSVFSTSLDRMFFNIFY